MENSVKYLHKFPDHTIHHFLVKLFGCSIGGFYEILTLGQIYTLVFNKIWTRQTWDGNIRWRAGSSGRHRLGIYLVGASSGRHGSGIYFGGHGL